MKKLSLLLIVLSVFVGFAAQAGNNADCELKKNMRSQMLRGDTNTNFVPASAQAQNSSQALQDVAR